MALAALDAQASVGWQPIETAPRDEFKTILLSGGEFGTRVVIGYGHEIYEDEAQWIFVFNECECKPTHWMPLPEPPKEKP